MNFRKSKSLKIKEDVENYSEILSMYQEPPREEITLDEFERFAVERLKLLREVENIHIRFKKGEVIKKMEDVMKEFLPNGKITVSGNFLSRGDRMEQEKANNEKLASDQRKDHISHFILRLAFARSEDLRRWFLTQELECFRFRFQQLTAEERNNFLKKNKLAYEPISPNEKESLINELKETTNSLFGNNTAVIDVTKTDYYKVPFTGVLDLVRSRRVYLHKGEAYVPSHELVSIILGIYRSNLSQALAITARRLPYLEEDTRLLPMLKNLSSAYIGDNYTSKNTNSDNKLNLADMEESVKISYPICMRNLHEGVRRDHHLKHFGRLQYGLFIKAAGLSLDEALLFWRKEFTQKMDLDKFEKQYAYNVRHSYGKEGKRADYTPYSCMKIITSNQPGPGDFHGCPFKHSDTESLKRRLQNYKVPNNAINEIIGLVKNQHYQVACARYFEFTHKLADSVISVNHPNQYFDESRKILSGGKPSMLVPMDLKEEQEADESNASDVKAAANLVSTDVTVDELDDDMEIL